VIYNFGDQPNDPDASQDHQCHIVRGGKDGKLYGTTDGGGTSTNGGFSGGTFFELDPPAATNGQWTLKVDVDFILDSSAGYVPDSAPLPKAGQFYGTTLADTVYVLTP
jgi:hypothetical protein